MTPPETLPVATREGGNTAGRPARENLPVSVGHPLTDARLRQLLRAVWSSSDFNGDGLTRIGQPVMHIEAQQGVFMLGALTMPLMAGLALLHY